MTGLLLPLELVYSLYFWIPLLSDSKHHKIFPLRLMQGTIYLFFSQQIYWTDSLLYPYYERYTV